MATQLYEQAIDKTVDWGGDESTNGLAVSGKIVQKFIKDSLEKKFGYLYYDSAALKYHVFADEDNFNKWYDDSATYASLRLFSFDAPAPATITAKATSDREVTILSSAENNVISFAYKIKDSGGNALNDNVNIRYQFSCNGSVTNYSTTIAPDLKDYDSVDGTPISLNIDSYLKPGTNNITIVFTTESTQATTTLTFVYYVVELKMTTSFVNTTAISASTESFDINYRIEGGGTNTKYMQIFLDGKVLDQSGLGQADAQSSNYSIGTASQGQIKIYVQNANGDIVIPIGKHNIQIRTYIEAGSATAKTQLYSNTLYYDFIISDPDETEEVIYILYAQEMAGGADSYIKYDEETGKQQDIKFTASQYSSRPFDYSVYSSTGSEIKLNIDIYKLVSSTNEGVTTINKDQLYSQDRTLASGKSDTVDYTFNVSGTAYIDITSPSTTDKLSVTVEVQAPEDKNMVIETCTNNLVAEYSAMNRSNTETNVDTWEYVTNKGKNNERRYAATFENVLWNAHSGWNDNALKLTNGAQVTFPFNLFTMRNSTATGDAIKGCQGVNGMTFEIEFETFDCQDDDATVMSFADIRTGSTFKSSINIKATSAEITSNSGTHIKTNFKDNERYKIAFMINAKHTVETAVYPDLMLIMVNGVLDRAININTTDSFAWQNPEASQMKFTIGNAEGSVGVKIYSLRIYSSSLTLEEELGNYIADSSDIVAEYKDNNVLDVEGTATPTNIPISLKLCKEKYATMVVYGHINAESDTDTNYLQASTNKKDNWPFDIEYTEPEKPELGLDPSHNFFVRDAWVSNQGTSSLSYPKRNLRLYFNKTRDSVTKDTSTEYLTEFYPYGYYNPNDIKDYGEGENGSRNKMPYACNGKTAKSYSAIYDKDGLASYGKDSAGETIKSTKIGYAKFQKVSNIAAKSISESNAAQLYEQYGCEELIEDGKGTKIYTSSASSDSTGTQRFIYIPVEYGNISSSTKSYFIEAYTPISIEKAIQFRYSAIKMFTRKTAEITFNDAEYEIPYFKKHATDGDHDKALDTTGKTQYYVLGGYWRQKDKSGYTDVWTLKTDFAESSMTHNGGIGSLWGDVMKNVVINNKYVCRTDAQSAVADISGYTDVRTSCDGKPMVVFCATRTVNADGTRTYGTPEFLGQFNIMTDKKSTPLFGFEGIYNVKGDGKYLGSVVPTDTIYCFEGLKNGSDLLTAESVCYDSKESIGKAADRPLYLTWEARWPDEGEDVETCFLESAFRFLNFCKDAVIYTVNGKDGYNINPYTAVNYDKAIEIMTAHPNNDSENPDEVLYYRAWDDSLGKFDYYPYNRDYTDSEGNPATYNKFSASDTDNSDGNLWFVYDSNFKYEDVKKEVNTEVLTGEIYKGRAPGFDAKYRGTTIYGANIEEDVETYYVDVWLTQSGSKWQYTDEYDNKTAIYTGSISKDDYEVGEGNTWTKGKSFRGATKMDYFRDKKYNYFDIYKVAAYYIYIMRFAAVDQVVKNTMITTEDRQHWYFINYDNDTVCGVRNDGHLVFNWDVDRNTYDTSMGTNGSYAFAGEKSILWNLFENDTDFMKIVQEVDSAMFNQNLLTYEAVTKVMNGDFMGYWCPRLYNTQELNKYISTFVKDGTSKFLEFLHGTRESHRNWWLRHRFDLFDAKWQTGEYMSYNIGFYLSVTDANSTNWVDLLTVEAASTFYFMLKYNTSVLETVSLKGTESYTYRTDQSFTIGDPFYMFAPYKIKTLNFRPSKKRLRSSLLLPGSTGLSWPKNKGALMTSLLIGDDDMTTYCSLEDISGLNTVTSLEEFDARNCNIISTTPEIGALTNLHIWRAEGSSLTAFAPAEGCILYEVSLPNGTSNNTKNNGALNETSTINMKDVQFTAAKDQDITKNPVWKYNPTASLQSLTLDNVTSDSYKDADGKDVLYFDGYKFVKNWMDAIIATQGNMKLYTLNLNISKTQPWDGVPVSWLLDLEKGIKALNLESFSGKLNVVGSGEDGALTEQEYNDIRELYGATIFDSTSKLVFNAKSSMFLTSSLKSKVATINGEVAGCSKDDTYFTIIRGEKDATIRATIFPADSTRQLRYVLRIYKVNASGIATTTTPTFNAEDNSYADITGVSIKTKNNICYVTANEVLATEGQYLIDVVDANNPSISYSRTYGKYIYLKMNAQIMPTACNVVTSDESVTAQGVYQPTVENVGKKVRYDVNWVWSGSQTDHNINVDIKSITVDFGNSTNASIGRNDIHIDNTTHTAYFEVLYTLPKDTDTETVRMSVSVAFDAINNSNLPTKIVNTTLKSVHVTGFNLLDADNKVVYSSTSGAKVLTINKADVTVNYTIQYLPTNYNIAIKTATVDDGGSSTAFSIDQTSNTAFGVNIKNNYKDGKYQSFSSSSILSFNAVDIYDKEVVNILSTDRNALTIQARIVYPEVYTLKRRDYDVAATSTNIPLTNANVVLRNGQGTVSSPICPGTNLITLGEPSINSTGNKVVVYYFDVKPESANLGDVSVDWTIDELDISFTNQLTDEETSNNANACKISVDGEYTGLRPLQISKSKETSKGATSFGIVIPAMLNSSSVTTVNVKAKVKFDANNNGELGDNENNEILSINESFTITRSYADCTSYKQFAKSQLYLVDTKCRYYKYTTWEANATALASEKVIGFAVNYSTEPETAFGISLNNITLNDYSINKPTNITGQTTSNLFDDKFVDVKWSPSVNATNISEANGKTLYYGSQVTKEAIEAANTASAKKYSSLFGVAHDYFANMYGATDVEGFIPSVAEAQSLIANSNTLNNSANYAKLVTTWKAIETADANKQNIALWTCSASNIDKTNGTTSFYALYYNNGIAKIACKYNDGQYRYARAFIKLV